MMRRFIALLLLAAALPTLAGAASILNAPLNSNVIDATSVAGADMCAQIAASAAKLPASGGTIDARGFTGTQACAGSMFASWPSQNPNGGWNVELGNVLIQTNVPQYVPPYTSLIGPPGYPNYNSSVGARIQPKHGSFSTTTLTVNASGCSGQTINVPSTTALTNFLQGGIGYSITGTGIPWNLGPVLVAATTSTTITASETVTCANTNVLTFTAPVVGLGTAGTDSYFARAENLAATGIDDTGVAVAAGTIAFQNLWAEEGSWYRNTYAGIAQTAYDFEVLPGVTGSTQNSGPYFTLHSQTPSSLITLANYHFMVIGGGLVLTQMGGPITDISAAGATGSSASVLIDAADVSLIGGHIESAADAILIGSRRFSHAVHIQNMTCATGVTNSCVRLSSTQGSDSVWLTDIASQNSTNIIQDDITGGCTITGTAIGSSFGGGTYFRGNSNTNNVWSPDTGCKVTPAAATQTNVAGPITQTTVKMAGIAGSITPVATGVIHFTISGDATNATAIADGAQVQASYGTGSAPTSASAVTGTQCGGLQKYVASTTAGKAPFSVNCVVTGLTLGTAYWLDLTLAQITGGTASISDISVSAFEIGGR